MGTSSSLLGVRYDPLVFHRQTKFREAVGFRTSTSISWTAPDLSFRATWLSAS